VSTTHGNFNTVWEGVAVQEGLVANLSRPGGNMTGLSVLNRELTGKRLEVMKEAVPMLKKIGALYNGANPTRRCPRSSSKCSAPRSAQVWSRYR
jgi:putative ABC transport system substrate-binding protein